MRSATPGSAPQLDKPAADASDERGEWAELLGEPRCWLVLTLSIQIVYIEPMLFDSPDDAVEIKINLRASKQDRDLIDRAATVKHLTRTEFMLSSARNAATDALLDQAFFPLATAQWDAFTAALDAQPGENQKLKRLLGRKAPWVK